MSTLKTKVQPNRLTKMLQDMPLEKKIEFAEITRMAYISQVANTQRKLVPAELRELDAGIAGLKAQLN